MAEILDQLVTKLRAALGSELKSVVLYGSAATGDQDAQYSDYNVLCVVTALGTKELRASEPVMRWWREKGNPSPLLLTEDELRNSTDCFAIEFSDIRARSRILYGPDLVSGMEVDLSFYRAQVEQELRGKLLRLRQKAAGVLSDREVLTRLMADSVATFCVLFRHALLLSGEPGPAGKKEIVAAAAAKFGIDARPFRMLLDVRAGVVKPKETEAESLLEAYMKQVQVVTAAVDALAK